jgi:outer membrane protein insertion porin family
MVAVNPLRTSISRARELGLFLCLLGTMSSVLAAPPGGPPVIVKPNSTHTAQPTPSNAPAPALSPAPVASPEASSAPVLPARPPTAAEIASSSEQGTPDIAAFAGKSVGVIETQGLKRIENDAAIAKLVTKPGKILTAESIRSDIQALFQMGFFDDISVRASAGKAPNTVDLTYVLKERPVISKLTFEGNERIATSDLKDVVKVKEWSILDVNKVKEDVALLQKHYEDKGFYLAKVAYSVRVPDRKKPDEVELIYKINDYDKVQIKKITFLNNKHFTDEQLKGVLQETREGGLFSFVSSSGNFKESAFRQDLQRLTYWYLDHGYVKFRYENPVVTVSDDKRWLYISIYVEEGDEYKMGVVDFAGDLLFAKDELSVDTTLRPTDVFSISKRNNDIQKLTEKYQDLGYAFVNVIPKTNIHDDTKLVDIDYDFEKGNLVYFGEINITGNSKTYDKVIRRELKIHEGELYSGSKLRQSRENVERLGFFTPGEVVFNTVSPKGRNDILNVDIAVKERSTGTITLGAGYGSIQKLFFTATVSEINLGGTGRALSLSGQYSADQINRSVNLGFTDPYAFDTRWSLGGDIYYVNLLIPNRYVTRKAGFDTRAGYPLAEFVNAYITYKFEGLQVLNVVDPSLTPDLYNPDNGTLSSIIWSVIRDKRNNRFETSEGNYQSVSIETAGLGGDKDFLKWVVNNRYYHHLAGDLVFRNSTEVGHIEGLGTRALPPSEEFYLGGPNNMKGFQFYTLGPNFIGSQGEEIPTGGTFEIFSLFELEYPILKEAGLKFVLFYDAGNSFDRFPRDGDPWTIRTDAGFGIRWFSPIGPLRFEWGFPLSAKPGEQSPVFSFFIGPPF